MKSNPQDFLHAYRGSFSGVLRWPQLDALWERVLARPQAWYIYAVGEPPPTQTAAPEQLAHFVAEMDALLRRDHRHDYCGIVYADDPHHPGLIKVYDPNNLGSSCGSAPGGPPTPAWVLSTWPPAPLEALQQPAGRRRWWQQLFAPRDSG